MSSEKIWMSTSGSEDTVTQWFIDNGFGEHSKNFWDNSFLNLVG